MTITDPRPTVEAPDDDPYLWLEELEAARALAWVEAQNKATMQRYWDARVTADRNALELIFDRSDKIPFPSRRNAKLFNTWHDAKHPRGVWRTTSFESFRREATEWDILLDLDVLAAREDEDWVWRGGVMCSETPNRAIVQLSRGGADAIVLREFDLLSREFVSNGFQLPEAKSSFCWLDRDSLLLASPFGRQMATRAGYARTVRLWRRGTDPLTAPVIFQTQENFACAWASLDRTAVEERIWFCEKPGFITTNLLIGDRTGPKVPIELPSDAEIRAHRDWLVVKPRLATTFDQEVFAPGSVIAISLGRFLAGDRRFTKIFEPSGRRALNGFFWCKDRLVLAVLDDLRPSFEVLTPGEGIWRREAIRGLPNIGSASIWPFDVEPDQSNGDLLAVAHDPITPPSLFLIEPNRAPALLKQEPRAFDPSGLFVTRHEARSVDGVRIPYVQIGPPGTSGDAPVHLLGYGGFGLSMHPFYNPAIGKLWLERGGTSVVAHIRGGRELGTLWYEAGRREGKRLSHDDFAAIAADLIKRGVTRPGRIAAEGGSNGGLLIANMLTRYPELFGALLCMMPVLDLRRSPKLLAGNWWIDEYGDPDKPQDWRFMSQISAYHVAEPGKHYPPILLTTSRSDDRVHPGHARKMAAKLQAMGYEAHLYEPQTGGHRGAKDSSHRAALLAVCYGFLRRNIGWDSAVYDRTDARGSP
jgi:prolyl oligopeptidase